MEQGDLAGKVAIVTGSATGIGAAAAQGLARRGAPARRCRPRSTGSAKALAPNAELIADPLFAEAQLASPRIPLLRLKVPAWAVMARILWHAGYHPEIENYRKAKHRAAEAADILTSQAAKEGATALVAHGYFNLMIGRELRRRGFRKTGAHRVKYWNSVVYEMP